MPDDLRAEYDAGRLAAERNGDTDSLERCVAVYRRWLHLDDDDLPVAALGATAANLAAGDPLWLLFVGPPGSGKTEAILPLQGLEYVHKTSTLTEAGLLSGVPKKEHAADTKGGLLREIGDFGIILGTDFSGVLTMNRDLRAAVMSALREVYDGAWTRRVGSDGGRQLPWRGKAGFVGAVTPSIDKHHAVLGALGERFVFYRHHVPDARAQARRRMANRGRERTMRAELAAATAAVLAAVRRDTPPRDLADGEVDQLVDLAVFVVAARTAVERDPYTRDVDVMPEAEAPGRLVGSLGALLAGIEAVGGTSETAWRIVTKVAWDCIPATRTELLRALEQTAPCKISALIAATGIPKTTAVRALEDLELLGLVASSRLHDNDPWTYELTAHAAIIWPPQDQPRNVRQPSL